MEHSFSGSFGKALKCPLGCNELHVELVLEILVLNHCTKKYYFQSISAEFFFQTHEIFHCLLHLAFKVKYQVL